MRAYDCAYQKIWKIRSHPVCFIQASGGLARSAGDLITFSAGGVFRLTGHVVRAVGSSLESVSNAVAGEAAADTGGATRRLLSRPMRVVSGTFKSVGDGILMLGDATERLAGEALGIVPDAFDVVQSGVGAIRKRVEFDYNDGGGVADWRTLEALQAEAGRKRTGGEARQESDEPDGFSTAAGIFPSEFGVQLERGGTAGGRRAPVSLAPGASTSEAARAGGARGSARALESGLPSSRRALAAFLGPRSTPHVALALICIALCARLAGNGPLGNACAAACGVACLAYLRTVEIAQQAEMLQLAEARALRAWQLRPGAPAESLGWLNTLLAAGWQTTFGCAHGAGAMGRPFE